MRNLAVTLLAVALASTLFAQEQLGLRLENFAGANSLTINPAGNLNNPLKWDLNLAGGGLFFENNYAFLRETSLQRLIKHRADAQFITAMSVEGPSSGNTFIMDFFNDRAQRFINVTGFVAGPSLAVRLGNNHSVGIFTNLRSTLGSVDIPNGLSYYKYDARPFQEGFNVPKLRGALLNWSEIGLNYALKIPTHQGSLNFGINLKYLQGYEAGYIESLDAYRHTKLPGNAISLEQPNSRYGYAAHDEASAFAKPNGRGLGADLGFTWILQDHEAGYRLKLGASLLDLGQINFNRNAQAHRFQVDSTVTVQLDDYNDFTLPQDLDFVIKTFSEKSLGDSLATLESNSFRMALPAALSLQADYGVTEFFYVNALYMQRLPTFNIGPKRGNLLAVTPRWQHRWYSVSMPVSVYNWSKVHVGLAARLGWLVIGSDDLGGVFINQNFTGADFYFAVKVNPFELGGGDGSGPPWKRSRRGGKVKCYLF